MGSNRDDGMKMMGLGAKRATFRRRNRLHRPECNLIP
jgi:hypothetical protein